MITEVLIVDGYNIIGSWRELKELKRESLELARDRLISILREYQRYSGMRVIIVFDAHMTTGPRKENTDGLLEVRFTRQEETADEMIERIVYEMEKRGSHIYVATSDYVEQQVTFGEGALRIPARELEKRIRETRKSIQKDVKELDVKKTTLGERLDEDIAKIFEKWRRDS